MFAKLRLLRGGTAKGGLSALKVPDDADPSADWQLIVDQNEITTRLIQQNNDHFGQANGTPFTIQPLLDIIGRNADHGLASVRDALQCPENSDATTALLDHLNDYRLPPISCQFTGQELKQSFKVWRENTSTSPHGTHLGLYKALTAPDAPPTAPQPPANAASPAPTLPPASLLPSHLPSSLPADRNNLARQQSTTLAPPCSTYPLPPPVQHPPVLPPTPSPFITNNNNHIPPHSPVPPQSNKIAGPLHPALPLTHPLAPGPMSPNNQIFDVMAILLTMAFTFGVIVHKWTWIHNAMLGNNLATRASINYVSSTSWMLSGTREWAPCGHANCNPTANSIQPCQWGSCQGRQCIDVVTLKQLTYKLSRVTRTDLITFDNDAKSCYDRIVMAYALLRCQQCGLPPSAAQAFGKFLDRACYYLKTKLGVLEEFYTNTILNALHGPGQGNRNGPSLWAIISTALMAALEDHHPGIQFTDPYLVTEITRIIDGFVDDTTLWANQFSLELETFSQLRYSAAESVRLLHSLIQETTDMAQWWENLLWSSGGRLELPKCLYYIIHWHFDATGTPQLATKAQLATSILIMDSATGTQPEIPFLEVSAAHKTLGVMVQPDNKMTAQRQHLVAQAKHHALALKRGPLTQCEGWTYYRSIFFPSIPYSLPSMFLTQCDLHTVDHACRYALLNAIGFHRSFPTTLVFALKTMGGVGFQQGAQHILQMILGQGRRTSSTVSQTLALTLIWSHQLSGTHRHPLDDYTTPLPHLTPSPWMDCGNPSVPPSFSSSGPLEHFALQNLHSAPV
ncbi:hypothetical protein ACA910_010358 [Epithemia clementina (nom. ined.)]